MYPNDGVDDFPMDDDVVPPASTASWLGLAVCQFTCIEGGDSSGSSVRPLLGTLRVGRDSSVRGYEQS